MIKKIFFIALCTLLSISTNAQDEQIVFPSLSPTGSITQIVGNTTIGIEYQRPSVRDRTIFGKLVPWNKLWRTGASKCTRLYFDKQIVFGGTALEPGAYSVFTIPNQKNWLVILNSDTSLSGTRYYDAGKNVATYEVVSQKTSRKYETLNIDIQLVNNNAQVSLSWDYTQIIFTLETSTKQIIHDQIEKNLYSENSTESNDYCGAASYLMSSEKDYDNALKLVKKAIALDSQNEWARNIIITVYTKQSKYDAALNEVTAAIKMLQYKGGRGKEIKQLILKYETIESLK